MKELVVDASVAINWFVAEPDSALAESLLEHAGRLAAPRLLMSELANGLWKNFLRQRIGRDTLFASLRHAEQIIEAWHADASLMNDAMELALELRHPVYHCLYLALARQLGTACVTTDGKLLGVAPAGLALALADWRT